MGQHKYNPTAIAAKNGEIPPKPKPKPLSKREREAIAYAAFQNAMHEKGLLTPLDMNILFGVDNSYLD